ncbi:hypothetical protein VMCG_01466 [Cytospora schulzeri]|uniref:Uncharacterized protein n=1 Tax=Cytospora schulzeri TaxID=448051 RepID=A0A423X5L8_9PEZI|nr:hypothetical protein VMCG_01466 [Valsa malicola]
MHFPFCTSKRHAHKKGKNTDKQDPQQQREQAHVALNFTPTPQGQVETERLLSGDPNAVNDLKSLLARAERRSRQVPRLNLNVRATDKFLQGSPEAIEDLLREQQLAEARVKKAAGRQRLGLSLMGDASLVGDSFEHSLREWCADGLSSSAKVKDEGECRGHWQIHYCPGGEGCNAKYPRPSASDGLPVTAEDAQRQTNQQLPNEGFEEEDDFPFDDHFADEEEYRQSLHEVTVFAVTPSRARAIVIPARTPTLSRKRGQSSLRELSSAVPSQAAPSERWSTQARTGSRESLMDNPEGEKAPDGNDVPEGLGARRSVRISMVAGPLSGPPAAPLPPSPPAPGSLRYSWPLPFAEVAERGVL